MCIKHGKFLVVLFSLLVLSGCSGGDSGGEDNTLVQNVQPVASILSPASATIDLTDTLTLTGSGRDSEDGELSGAALVWSSSLDAELGTGETITTQLSEGAHTITLTVMDSGQLTHTDTITVVVENAANVLVPAANSQPMVAILAMPSDAQYTELDNVNFEATVSDNEDIAFDSSQLVWFSSIDGELGTGTSISTSLGIGAHTISATVTDSGGLSHTDFITVLIVDSQSDILFNTAPAVSLSHPENGQLIELGRSTNLVGLATDNEDGSIAFEQLSWWSSRDGELGAGSDIFVNLSLGVHLIELKATDSLGAESIKTVAVSVIESLNPVMNNAPFADPGDPQSVFINDIVVLSSSGSFDRDGDEISHSWSFESLPADSETVLWGSETDAPSFMVDVAGDYVLKLVVNDGKVNSVAKIVTVSTLNFKPIALAGDDQYIATGVEVSLDGSSSLDLEGSELTYQWLMEVKPDASNATLVNANSVSPSFTPDVDGTYTFTLAVNDGLDTSALDLVQIHAGNIQPVANAILLRDEETKVGSTVILDGSLSLDINGDALNYQWRWLTRPEDSSAEFSSASVASPSVTVDKAGLYRAELTVNDGVLSSDAQVLTFNAYNPTDTILSAGFEDTTVMGFVGDWQVTSDTSHSGSYALRPAQQDAPNTVTTTLVVNGEHTQLSFWYLGLREVDLYVDNEYWATYSADSSNQWRQAEIIVAPGSHTYRWEVKQSTNGWADLYLDDIIVSHTEPMSEGATSFGFEGHYPSQDFSNNWVVSNWQAHSGAHALQPPYQTGPATVATEIAISEVHTKLNFWYTGEQAVDLYIDDDYWATYDANSTTAWSKAEVIVPEGSHSYRWQFEQTEEGRADLYLDDIAVSYATPKSEGMTAFGFEGDHLSQDFSNQWVVSNWQAHTGEHALQPPYQAGPGLTSTSINMTQAHTKLTFWYLGQQAVDLYIDDTYWATYHANSSHTWQKAEVIVAEGAHRYRWQVEQMTDGWADFYLDDVSISYAIPMSEGTAVFGFEGDYPSQDFTNDWVVSNWQANSGDHALQPPYQTGPATVSTAIEMTDNHTKLTFWYFGSATLDLYIDEVYWASYDASVSQSWLKAEVLVPEGTHTYRWQHEQSAAGWADIYLDDISIDYVTPMSEGTGSFGFEGDYVSQDFTGWHVVNWRAHTGDHALRPAYVDSPAVIATEVEITEVHSQLSFWLSGHDSVRLYVDDTLQGVYGANSDGWVERRVVVSQGSHTYRWEVETTGAGRPDVYLDDISVSSP